MTDQNAIATRLPKPAAYCVVPADGSGNVPNMPGHLYFFPRSSPSGAIPPEEEKARQQLEYISSVLRIVFPDQKPGHFREHFATLLVMAQGAFTPAGFLPESLNTLDVLKREIVQQAGPQIKADYLKRLAKWVLCAFALILVISYSIEWSNNRYGGSRPERVAPRTADSGTTTSATADATQQVQVSVLHTGLLLAFSMWGLFFASCTRNLTPTFDSLVIPDTDLMHPWVRLTFHGIAILVLVMAFQVRMITVAFGDTFSTAQINQNTSIAILVGLLLGIAERAVPREAIRWAAELVTRSGPQST
jgi:hypothetical protein